MVKKAFRKLISRQGESLVESLLAILIFTLASIAMYSMVTAAADINMTVKEEEKIHEQQMLIAEQAEGTSTAGTITMSLDTGVTKVEIAHVAVDVYGEDGALFSYFVASVAGAGGS